ncbi:MAG: glycosyltransferase family 9 protein [Gammaproteobacteria bacterium]|nr:glycosyltransferase family 9 protein [Gammaproteobacteria bacterium]
MSFISSPPASLCILRLSAIGDVTHVLPALNCIRQQWPDCKISWIIGKLEHQLVHDIAGVEFIIYDKSAGREANKTLKQTLKGRRFDILLHMQISLRASLASRHIQATYKIGFDFKRGRNFQWLFSNKKIPYVPHQHVLDSFLEFPKLLGLNTETIEWHIPVPESDRLFIQKATHNKRYVVINPSASNAVRNWGADHYATIIDYLSERYGLICVLSGGPSDNEIRLSQTIAEETKNKPLLLTGQTTLKQLAALLQQAQLVIAPDTGPAHIANALGTPVIGLYANSNPYRTGPYSWLDLCVNLYPEALLETYNKTVEQVRWGRRVRRDDIMEFITKDHVIDKIDLFLEQWQD